MNKNILGLFFIVMVILCVGISGCSSSDKDVESSVGTDSVGSYSGAADEAGSEEVDSVTIADGALQFNHVYEIPVSEGDRLDIFATASGATSFYCLDEEGYQLLENHESADKIIPHIVADTSTPYTDTTAYVRSVNVQEDGTLYLVVLTSLDIKYMEGDINIVRYKGGASSEGDTSAQSEYVPSTTIHTSGNDLAENMRKSAQEAKDKSDKWQEDRLKDDVTYG